MKGGGEKFVYTDDPPSFPRPRVASSAKKAKASQSPLLTTEAIASPSPTSSKHGKKKGVKIEDVGASAGVSPWGRQVRSRGERGEAGGVKKIKMEHDDQKQPSPPVPGPIPLLPQRRQRRGTAVKREANTATLTERQQLIKVIHESQEEEQQQHKQPRRSTAVRATKFKMECAM